MNIPEISLKPVALFNIGPVAISNNMMGAFLTTFFLIILGIFIKRNASMVPGRIQMIMEILLEFLLKQLEMALGSEKTARKVLPIIATTFLFLVISNQLLLLPLIGNITMGEDYLFITPTAHYSLTIAFAVMVLGIAHIVAFLQAPLRYIGNYFKFHLFFKIKSIKELPMAMVEFFLGIMDIIGEIAKFISTSTRLFGNMFAGGVVVAIVSGLMFVTQFVVPIPFIVLGILSGFVQAFVFTMLMLIFFSQSLNSVKK